MDTQTLINLGVGLAIAGGGWFAREVWGAVKELRKDMKDIEVALPSHYVRKDEFTAALKDLKKEITDGFTRIYDKLDDKQDKP